MIFAVIPWSQNEYGDRLFYTLDGNGNKVPEKSAAYIMYEEFIRLGHTIHTIDMYEDLHKVDYFLLYVMEIDVIHKLINMGLADRMIYCNAEPPSVIPYNTPEGFEKLKGLFPYILTWNREWADDERVFHRVIAYYFDPKLECKSFGEKKLLTAISANKKSVFEDELYSEREKVYTYFEEKYPEEFDLYGYGWDKNTHPCYKGTVKDKKEIYHDYKFAVCFENTRTPQDYMTEKIWDCISSGIVPIYLGTGNVTEFIPKECFIDYEDFKNLDELASFISNMTEEEYAGYQKAAAALLDSPVRDQFSGKQYAVDIIHAAEHDVQYELKLSMRLKVAYEFYMSHLKKGIKSIIRR